MAGTRIYFWIMCSSTKSVSLVFSLLFWGPFSAQSNPIGSPERLRIAPGLDDGHGGVLDPSLLEQDSEVDMQSLLETLKGQFLHTFNLTRPGSHVLPGATRVEPPEYMLELYNRFANDRTAMPSANIVRSFKNEGKCVLLFYSFIYLFFVKTGDSSKIFFSTVCTCIQY